jgi:hypothetical protein
MVTTSRAFLLVLDHSRGAVCMCVSRVSVHLLNILFVPCLIHTFGKHRHCLPAVSLCNGREIFCCTAVQSTDYALDGPGGGKIFRTRPDRSWGTPSLLYNGYRGFPEGKAAGTWC